MNIKLSQQQVFALSREFAEDIYQQMLGRRLARTGCGSIWAVNPSFSETKAAIASVQDRWDRVLLLAGLRFNLEQKFKETGSPRTWQEYVAQVEQAKQAA